MFDTTLRDGGQTRGVDFSKADKIAISAALDEIGIDYIEGGWPGPTPQTTPFSVILRRRRRHAWSPSG